MGKNRTIKSLGKVIGNIAVHKITLKYGNMPKSKSHTFSEIITYRDNAIGIAQEFNWSDSDKIRIKQEALKNFNKRIKKYKDVKFPIADANKLIDETIKECII